jgi:FtsP/CotA-like multicopper oxidase with cupredoxin domain
MVRKNFLTLMVVAVALVAIPWGMDRAHAGDGGAAGGAPGTTWYANSPAPDPLNPVFTVGNPSGKPIRKFVTRLPGLGSANANEIGQYIPIANQYTTPTYSGSDYYRISAVEFTEQVHPDLPKATRFRGYVDASTSASLAAPHYLGPMIIAQRNRPVRMLFLNQLPTNNAGKLFIPTDYTLMGAGIGPDGVHSYSQNRAVVHLHGGLTPWISDGTPHQWVTPTGEAGPYFVNPSGPEIYNAPFFNYKGVSFKNVPDMVGSGKSIVSPTATDGRGTYYYTNQQSSRLMFYHEHASGTTRLGVYVGLAAPYLIYDTNEVDYINRGIFPGTGLGVYKYGIPLVIQDKTFVPLNVNLQDNTWNAWRTTNSIAAGLPGDLWFPHKYEPNQDPTSETGASLFGRWDYGPWFWPPVPTSVAPLPANPGYAHLLPGEASDFSNPWIYNNTIVPEAFMDTMMVNGNVYPYASVSPQTYRFRILNACNDRNLNLQMYVADTGGADYSDQYLTPNVPNPAKVATATATVAPPTPGPVTGLALASGGVGYTTAPKVYIYGGGGTGATATVGLAPRAVASIAVPNGGWNYTSAPKVTIYAVGGVGAGATATATVANGRVTKITLVNPGAGYITAPVVSLTGGGGSNATAAAALVAGPIATITLTDGGDGYTGPPTVLVGHPSEVAMVPAVATAGYPATWPTDGRAGGVPDPTTMGPSIIQIGSEGGFLPGVALIPSQPVNYDYNRRNIVVLNVLDKALFMGPAERADILVDFSQFAGKTIIFYNDAPAPVPAFDPRYDYYTGDPDQLVNGGAATTIPGYGPNTRTVMQIRVANTAPASVYNVAGLQPLLPQLFALDQAKPIVPEAAYGPAYGQAFTNTYSTIQANSLTFNDFGGYFPAVPPNPNGTKTVAFKSKAIQELFDDYGRMNAILGTELPLTNILVQTTIPLKYVDPPTEGGDPVTYPGAVPIKNGDAQLWKITHNGVDTHSIHIHLVNWQVINRVGWDGAIRPPDPNELGWKETVRMNPLEDIIVAAQFKFPTAGLPFALPTSTRYYDPTNPKGTTWQFSPFDALGNPVTVTNDYFNFGWEYVWHCHLLGHEENDMMRPIAVTP